MSPFCHTGVIWWIYKLTEFVMIYSPFPERIILDNQLLSRPTKIQSHLLRTIRGAQDRIQRKSKVSVEGLKSCLFWPRTTSVNELT